MTHFTYLTVDGTDEAISLDHRLNHVLVSEEKFLKQLEAPPNPTTDLLPPGVLYVSADRTLIIIQEPPKQRLITIRHRMQPECSCEGYDEETEQFEDVCELCTGEYDDIIEVHQGKNDGWGTYLLSTPWLIYPVQVSHNSLMVRGVLASAEEVASYDQPLSKVPLPNLYENGGICPGSADTSFSRYASVSVSDGISKSIDALWSSTFNYDVQHFLDSAIWSHIMDMKEIDNWTPELFFERWEALSIDDVLHLPWNADAVKTLNTLIEDQTHQSTRHRLSFLLRNISMASRKR